MTSRLCPDGGRMIKVPAAILAAFLFPGGALGQPACGRMETVIEGFRIEHGEVPQIEMRSGSGDRLIVLANPQTGSWSLFVLPSSNETVACLVSTGSEFTATRGQPGRSS